MPFYYFLKVKKPSSRDLWGAVQLSITVQETQVSNAPASIMGLFYFISREITSSPFILGTFVDDILVAIKSEK